ncbi:hypothetical protein IVB30_43615 [Bradyrhizobium sp. 200]|uniref:hypothetical protein n=1 Tax=Bradyrhizobium sp. 200 TaxID=2782665 RepID=UPI0020005494|nr:hypothetical protein [Bradyrhizobium sp. 200]UPJ54675.1 hypothetical protein IVB30_43615 [Bradyrhizobium sp. 200]
MDYFHGRSLFDLRCRANQCSTMRPPIEAPSVQSNKLSALNNLKPAFSNKPIVGRLDVRRRHDLTLPDVPTVYRLNDFVQGGLRLLSNDPMDCGQQFHAVRCFETLDQSANPLHPLSRFIIGASFEQCLGFSIGDRGAK